MSNIYSLQKARQRKHLEKLAQCARLEAMLEERHDDVDCKIERTMAEHIVVNMLLEAFLTKRHPVTCEILFPTGEK